MSTSPEQMSIPPEAAEQPKYFVNFNQDCTSLCVGSQEGFSLYCLSNVDELELLNFTPSEPVALMERLFSSSLVVIVSETSPRKLKVCHYKKGTEICNYSYSNAIRAVKLNRQRLVVCLEESIYIHSIRDMKVVHTIRDTPPNPNGVCALSHSNDNCYLAYPGSASKGQVQIFDTINLQAKTMLDAHESPLAAIAFCPAGRKIATASEKGTLIRVFSIADGTRLFDLRRGLTRYVNISCVAFSTCGNYVGCSSNTETVHVFKLEPQTSSEDSSWGGINYYFQNYLPTTVSDVFSQDRACVTATLPFTNVKTTITITNIQGQQRVLVATKDGWLYVYNNDGKEKLSFHKKFSLQRNGGDATETDTTCSPPVAIESGSPLLGSYAGILKGNPVGVMSESDRLREMAAATESPPRNAFHFNDDREYPPLGQTSD